MLWADFLWREFLSEFSVIEKTESKALEPLMHNIFKAIWILFIELFPKCLHWDTEIHFRHLGHMFMNTSPGKEYQN